MSKYGLFRNSETVCVVGYREVGQNIGTVVESSERGLQQVLNSDKMSAYGGSNTRINTLGRRVNSRPDLAGGYMMGGNGYQTEFSEYRTFSKNSMGGGGGGGGQG